MMGGSVQSSQWGCPPPSPLVPISDDKSRYYDAAPIKKSRYNDRFSAVRAHS